MLNTNRLPPKLAQRAMAAEAATQARLARDDFERRNTPTHLKVLTGIPEQIQGLTAEGKALRSFAESAQETIRIIGDVHFKSHEDATLTPGAQLLRSAEHAARKIKDARAQFDRIAERAKTDRDNLASQLVKHLEPENHAGKAAIDSELRAYLRSLPAEKVSEALTDPAVRAAAVRAPRVLSGLAKELHDRHSRDHMRDASPDEFARYTELQTAMETGLKALKAIEEEAASLIDFNVASELSGGKVSL